MASTRQIIANPLTIVGIFATAAEATAALVAGALTPESQQVFVWFLLLFPFFIASLFFATLWFRPEVLYSPDEHGGPSDYRRAVLDQKNMRAWFEAVQARPELASRIRQTEDFKSLQEVFDGD